MSLGTPLTGPDSHVLHIDSPAKTLMPIWVRLECKGNMVEPWKPLWGAPQFPFFPHAYNQEHLYDLELRRNGETVPPLECGWKQYSGPPAPMNPGRSTSDKVPLHMRYRIDQPGHYEVRLVSIGTVLESKVSRSWLPPPSEWAAFDVEASSEAERAALLRELQESPPDDAGLLLHEYLPKLTADPGPAQLKVLQSYLAAPEEAGAFAWYALNYFPDDDVRPIVLKHLAQYGANRASVRYIVSHKTRYEADAEAIVDTVLPFLASGTDDQAVGTLGALQSLRHEFSLSKAAMRRMDKAVVHAGPALSMRKGTAYWLCKYAGEERVKGLRDVLWSIVLAPEAQGEAGVALAKIADPDDLAPLGRLLAEEEDYRLTARWARAIDEAYGPAAVPVLKEALVSARAPGIRSACAWSLAAHDVPEAYRYYRELLLQSKVDQHDEGRVIKLLAPEMMKTRIEGNKVISSYIQDPVARRAKLIELIDAKLAQIQPAPASR
jgi:hypothetical protein